MRRTASAALAGALAALAVPALARELLAPARGGARWTLVEEGGALRLEAGTRVRPLQLPARARVRRIVALGEGWLLAGVAPGEGGPELFLLAGDDRTEHVLPPPPGRAARLRQGPLPLVVGATLVGVAWHEGPESRRFDVRWASFLGDRFGAPEVVSPAGPGSQLAVAGAPLADGRLLLAWAGYDGADDEIWVSVRAPAGARGRWSPPTRAADDNATPDITPAVVPLGVGALVVWSRYDGSEYRLMSARFDGERMLPARWAAPPGSIDPTIVDGPAGPAILFRDAGAGGWAIVEVGADGAPGRTSRVAVESELAPSVGFEGTTLVWSFGERTAVSAWE
jgi:hypothetical protein